MDRNRLIILLGAVAAVIAAVGLALAFGGGRERSSAPPPAAQGGLTVDLADAPGLESERELGCYVEGRFVGMATLADCARRNGLATDALDVGVDQSGAAVAFRPPPGPPPLETTTPEPQVQSADAGPEAVAAGGVCMRHAGGEWRVVDQGASLAGCVRALYAGTCVRPGEAQYGRWNETTLRLVPRKVEQSNDNTRFRTLAEQDRGCQFPDLRG